jgi:methionyl aminopeptidase
MKLNSKELFQHNSYIALSDESRLVNQRIAGIIAANVLIELKQKVESKTTQSLIELDLFTEQFIKNAGGIPAFKNYKGFPASVCISVNKQIVHGVPTNYILQDGDVIKFDVGVIVNGSIADTAITCIYGTPKSSQHVALKNAAEDALMKGISAISVGKRLGCIGHAIYRCAQSYGFNVITQYGGHGVGTSPDGNAILHTEPFISNKSSSNEGVRIQPGLTIAIEPLLVIGHPTTFVDKNKWTVNCHNICSHYEHTVYVHEDSVEIITWRGIDNENYLKSNKIYFN